MRKDHPAWPLVSVLVVIAFGIVGYFVYDVGTVMTDPGYFRWDRAHHLAHGYRRRQPGNLYRLRLGLLEYAQHHQGSLPPMQNAATVQRALMPYINHVRPFYNITTRRPLIPSANLSNRKYRSITNGNTMIAFYDPDPPEGYPEVYYVTVSGHVDHVSLSRWPVTRRVLGVADH